jgi:hypothetical protein
LKNEGVTFASAQVQVAGLDDAELLTDEPFGFQLLGGAGDCGCLGHGVLVWLTGREAGTAELVIPSSFRHWSDDNSDELMDPEAGERPEPAVGRKRSERESRWRTDDVESPTGGPDPG